MAVVQILMMRTPLPAMRSSFRYTAHSQCVSLLGCFPAQTGSVRIFNNARNSYKPDGLVGLNVAPAHTQCNVILLYRLPCGLAETRKDCAIDGTRLPFYAADAATIFAFPLKRMPATRHKTGLRFRQAIQFCQCFCAGCTISGAKFFACCSKWIIFSHQFR